MPAAYIPQDVTTLAAYLELAGRLEVAGYDRMWIGELNEVDAVSSATLAAVGTERARASACSSTCSRARPLSWP